MAIYCKNIQLTLQKAYNETENCLLLHRVGATHVQGKANQLAVCKLTSDEWFQSYFSKIPHKSNHTFIAQIKCLFNELSTIFLLWQLAKTLIFLFIPGPSIIFNCFVFILWKLIRKFSCYAPLLAISAFRSPQFMWQFWNPFFFFIFSPSHWSCYNLMCWALISHHCHSSMSLVFGRWHLTCGTSASSSVNMCILKYRCISVYGWKNN